MRERSSYPAASCLLLLAVVGTQRAISEGFVQAARLCWHTTELSEGRLIDTTHSEHLAPLQRPEDSQNSF